MVTNAFLISLIKACTYIISDAQVYDSVMADVMKEIAKKKKKRVCHKMRGVSHRRIFPLSIAFRTGTQ